MSVSGETTPARRRFTVEDKLTASTSRALVKVVAIKSGEAYWKGMSRLQKQPLRALTEAEHVARALLAVSAGASFTDDARAVGRATGWPSWWAASIAWGWP